MAPVLFDDTSLTQHLCHLRVAGIGLNTLDPRCSHAERGTSAGRALLHARALAATGVSTSTFIIVVVVLTAAFLVAIIYAARPSERIQWVDAPASTSNFSESSLVTPSRTLNSMDNSFSAQQLGQHLDPLSTQSFVHAATCRDLFLRSTPSTGSYGSPTFRRALSTVPQGWPPGSPQNSQPPRFQLHELSSNVQHGASPVADALSMPASSCPDVDATESSADIQRRICQSFTRASRTGSMQRPRLSEQDRQLYAEARRSSQSWLRQAIEDIESSHSRDTSSDEEAGNEDDNT